MAEFSLLLLQLALVALFFDFLDNLAVKMISDCFDLLDRHVELIIAKLDLRLSRLFVLDHGHVLLLFLFGYCGTFPLTSGSLEFLGAFLVGDVENSSSRWPIGSFVHRRSLVLIRLVVAKVDNAADGMHQLPRLHALLLGFNRLLLANGLIDSPFGGLAEFVRFNSFVEITRMCLLLFRLGVLRHVQSEGDAA